MNNIFSKKSLLFVLPVFIIGNSLSGQNAVDSLPLKTVLQKVLSGHPTIKAAQETIINADARIGLAKTGYNPNIDLTASFANLGPVTKLTLPEFGTFQLYPGVNYSAAFNLQQLLYDFGRTHQNVELEKESKVIGEQTLEQIKQKLSVYTINNFYSLVFLQAAIRIKEEQETTLSEHLNYIEKQMATGSATEYQVLTTKVRISTVESQKVDLIAALKAQQAILNSLMGNDQNIVPVVRKEISVEVPSVPSDSVLSFAFRNRDEVLINEKKISLAELRLGMVRLQNKPYLSLQASGGAKNGYIPYLNRLTPNYVIGVGIKVPVFDGMKNKYNISQAQSAINSLSYESDYARRSISNEVAESEAMLVAAEKKVSQSELQLQQALKAYSLAQTSFRSGIITNLDLLDANTSVSESSLMLLKAKIDHAASVYKLKAALGQRVY